MKWLRKLKNKLKAKFTAGHHAMSLEEMMAMSAEELGRRFREHGDWYYSKKRSFFNDIELLLEFFFLIVLLVCAIIIPLVGLFIESFNFIFYMRVFAIVVVIVGLTIVLFAILGKLRFSSFLRRKYYYDEFDNLIGYNSEHEFGSLYNFISYLGVPDEKDDETPLGEYRNAMHDMIQMHYDNEPYTDEEIGSFLKLMIPIAFMVNDGVKINIQNYSILDSKYNLTKQAVELNKHLKAEADKRKAENNANIKEKERLKQEKEKQKEKNRKRKEQQEAVESVGRFIDLDNRVKTKRNILNESPEYNRIEDATKKIHEKTESMNSAAENMTSEKD